MTTNNAENKAAFMACYWGQESYVSDKNHDDILSTVNPYTLHKIIAGAEDGCLELTSLSDISDEHAIEVAIARGFVNVSRVKFVFDGYWVTIKIKGKRSVTKFVFYRDMSQPEIDKLRKLCYLVAWRDLSVEELINRGWAKLKVK